MVHVNTVELTFSPHHAPATRQFYGRDQRKYITLAATSFTRLAVAFLRERAEKISASEYVHILLVMRV